MLGLDRLHGRRHGLLVRHVERHGPGACRLEVLQGPPTPGRRGVPFRRPPRRAEVPEPPAWSNVTRALRWAGKSRTLARKLLGLPAT